MANKRQRLARKRFHNAPGSTTYPSSGTVNDGLPKKVNSEDNKTQKLKSNGIKRKREDQANNGLNRENNLHARKKMRQKVSLKGGNAGADPRKKFTKLKKHPLRIPGSKPGEGCFICHSAGHIAKACPQKNEIQRKKICLLCREVGHTLKSCPNKEQGQETKFCYNCGKDGHRLAECTEPIKSGGTTFAQCFLCKQQGHLSKNCSSNTHGIYPKGGCCKICGGVTHLAKDCPEKGTGKSMKNAERVKMQIFNKVASASQPGVTGKHIVFRSGDDLEDDFLEDESGEDGADQAAESGNGLEEMQHEGYIKTRKESKQKGKKKKDSKGESLALRPSGKTPKNRPTKVVNF